MIHYNPNKWGAMLKWRGSIVPMSLRQGVQSETECVLHTYAYVEFKTPWRRLYMQRLHDSWRISMPWAILALMLKYFEAGLAVAVLGARCDSA